MTKKSKSSDPFRSIRPTLAAHVKGVGVTEAARRADVKHPQVSLWLRGKGNMSPTSIVALARAMGFRVVVTLEPLEPAPSDAARAQ